MKITLDISDADIMLALQTAAESGIGYWATEFGWGSDDHNLRDCFVIAHNDRRDPAMHTRHELDIERGLRMMYQQSKPDGQANGRGENPGFWDANQADCFVQYAAFGELRYG